MEWGTPREALRMRLWSVRAAMRDRTHCGTDMDHLLAILDADDIPAPLGPIEQLVRQWEEQALEQCAALLVQRGVMRPAPASPPAAEPPETPAAPDPPQSAY